MIFFSAIKKLLIRSKKESYYNSDHILTTNEKQSLIIGGFLTVFPLIITMAIILINNIG